MIFNRRSWIPALVVFGFGCGAPNTVPSGPAAGWPAYGGPAEGTRYSPLETIRPANVSQLELAWSFRTGDFPAALALPDLRTTFQATPILVGDALVLCTPLNRVLALDAETGEKRWAFDPEVSREGRSGRTCRGVAAWAGPNPEQPCGTRVLTGTLDARLIALDARTGRRCPDFGVNGEVDLLQGLGETRAFEVQVTSPPTVIGNVVATGSLVADNRRADAPGGVIRGYDVRSGALVWAFDPVPPGSPPPANATYHRGTPNAWGVFSADPERDLLFVPTGNPSNDFYRGGRGDIDHYGSSVLALRGSTGELAWSFQTVHHDLWDYDVGSQPSVVSLRRAGQLRRAVVQPTKVGHVFVLDAERGTPIDPIDERPVPASDVGDERSAPTQPFPTLPPPLQPHGLAAEDMFGLTPFDRGACRQRLAELRNDGPFTPPSLRGSVQYPSVAGGANWGSAAIDPSRQLMVVAQTRLANVQRLIPRAQVDGTPSRPPLEILFRQEGAPFGMLQGVLVSPWGIPCTAPPWFTLSGVDLQSGQTRWEIPLGSTRGQAPWPFWFDWGTPGMGGPLATASGLIFIAATMDDGFRALSTETGEVLWRTWLPAGGQATPMTYRVRDGGRQFVVIAAGGHATLGTTPGDWVLAYALPEED